MNALRPAQGKADPAVYLQFRENAVKFRPSRLPENAIHVILMDWHVPSGTFTVLAAVDGTASLYLSSGGGPPWRRVASCVTEPASEAGCALTQMVFANFRPAASHPLPVPGSVSFYVATSSGVYVAVSSEDDLKSGISPFKALNCDVYDRH
jgi:hypothetical protein